MVVVGMVVVIVLVAVVVVLVVVTVLVVVVVVGMAVVIVLVAVVVVLVVGMMDFIVFVEVLVMVVEYKTYFFKEIPLCNYLKEKTFFLWGDKFSFWSPRRNVFTTIKFIRKDSFGNCLLLFVFAFCWLVLLHFLAHPFCKLPIFDEN